MAQDASRRVVLRQDVQFNGVKIFSATMYAQREQLGPVVTEWIARNPHLAVVEMVVTQSSDASFHCIAISIFYFEHLAEPEPHAPRRRR